MDRKNEQTKSLDPQKESGTKDSPHVSLSTVAYLSITPTVSHRYSPLKFHARGGMGEVWLAEDGEIGRQVALKRLSRNDDGAKERFIAEAQIAGQLEHPGIVPVHDLGIDKSGRPYYIMKFVHGRTLRDAIEEYHASANKNVSGRVLQQQRLLDHFVDVCEAVAFAHTRGVVHRDLKPSNIMLGLFGETIVLDWGLAKVLNQPELAGLPTALTSSGRSSETVLGSVLGTPSYMPPEIAEGKAADAGPATDVYLLGATLYEILTGTAPRSGSSMEEIVQLARNVAPVPPRQKNKNVARPLETICLKAMAKREGDRYESALDLAEDTRRYLAGEPVTAYREPFHARLWRWVKRHRIGLARTATAAIIAATAMVAVSATLETARIAAVEKTRMDIKEFRGHYDEALFHIGNENDVQTSDDASFVYFNAAQGRQSIESALALAERWGPNVESMPIDEERDALRQQLHELWLLKAHVAKTFPSPNLPDEAPGALERAERFRALSRNASESKGNSVLDDSDRSASAFTHFLRGERYRTRVNEPNDLLDRFALARPRQLDLATEEYSSALRIDPDHYWSRLQLGRSLLADGRHEEAIGTLGACTALRPDSPWAFTARGLALARAKRFDEALQDLGQALAIDPDFHPAKLNRGWVHWKRSNTGDVQAAAQDLTSVLADPDQPLILAAFYLGQLQLQQGELQAALGYFHQFAEGKQEKGFRPVHWYLARVHYLLGDDDAGLKHLNQYLELSSPPDQFDPRAPEAHFYRGKFLRETSTGDLKNLVSLMRAKIAINDNAQNQNRLKQLVNLKKPILNLALDELQLAETGMQSTGLYYELAVVNMNLGKLPAAEDACSTGLKIEADNLRLLYQRGEVSYFLKNYPQAQRDFTRATRATPQSPREEVLLAAAHSWSGILFSQAKQIEEAKQQAAFALNALLNAPAGEPETYNVLHNVACTYGMLSQLYPNHRRLFQDTAIRNLTQAIEKASKVGQKATEVNLIQGDTPQFFGQELTERPEFAALLNLEPQAR